MIDEIFVKSALLYHGGRLCGKSVNHPDKLVKTALACKCLYGADRGFGPFFTRVINLMLISSFLNATLLKIFLEVFGMYSKPPE